MLIFALVELLKKVTDCKRFLKWTYGGEFMLFVREDIPSNIVEAETKLIKGFWIELNLPNDKWLLDNSYNPHTNNIANHFKVLSDFLDSHSSA